jgi:hypothetical protein
LPDGKSEIFFAEGLDRILLICPSRCFVARRSFIFSFAREAKQLRRVGKAKACPPLQAEENMVGTAQARLCRPYWLGLARTDCASRDPE